MGNTFTFIHRLTVRKTRRFNIQSKTEKFLKKQQQNPTRAPLYEATMREVERLSKELPDLTEEIKKQDEGLLRNLRKVYVTSKGENKDSFSTQKVDSSVESRWLDSINMERAIVKDPAPGKYTIEQAVSIVEKYQNNPYDNTHEVLAKMNNLDVATVAKITKHVKIFDFFDDKKKSKYGIMADVLPPSVVGGKNEVDLMYELHDEMQLKIMTYFERAKRLEQAKAKNEKYIENPNIPLISAKVTDDMENIYMETDIYRKTGKEIRKPLMIEDKEIEKLRDSGMKKLKSGNNEEDKDKDGNKDDTEQQQKSVGQT